MSMTDARAQWNEQAIGANHATLTDTINRLVKGINNFRLIKSGANLTLQAVNGNLVDINEVIYACTAMPTLPPPAVASTTYYIYLYNNAGTETLEYSATGYTLDSKGRPYKTGDATRRLMGMARTTAGNAWADSLTQRFVISWDWQRPLRLHNNFSANRSLVNASSYVEINSEIRVEALLWTNLPGANIVDASAHGPAWNGTAGKPIYTAISLDGNAVANYHGGSYIQQPASSGAYPCQMATRRIWHPGDCTEGYHYFTLFGCGDGSSTASWQGTAAPESTSFEVVIYG